MLQTQLHERLGTLAKRRSLEMVHCRKFFKRFNTKLEQ